MLLNMAQSLYQPVRNGSGKNVPPMHILGHSPQHFFSLPQSASNVHMSCRQGPRRRLVFEGMGGHSFGVTEGKEKVMYHQQYVSYIQCKLNLLKSIY